MSAGRAPLVVAAALVATALLGCGDDDERGDGGRVQEAADISVYELRVGDCIAAPGEIGTEVGTVRVVPCDEAHTQEIFALIPFTDENGEELGARATFPSDETLTAFADSACVEPFADYFAIDYIDSSLFLTYLVPSVRSWEEENDREIICIAQTDGSEVNESLAGDGR